MFLFRTILIVLFVGCLLSTSPVEAARKKKNKKKKSDATDHVLYTDTLNPSQDQLHSAFEKSPHLHNMLSAKNKDVEEDEKLKLNSQIPELVEDIRFAVNNFGDVSLEKATALDKLGRVVFKLGNGFAHSNYCDTLTGYTAYVYKIHSWWLV